MFLFLTFIHGFEITDYGRYYISLESYPELRLISEDRKILFATKDYFDEKKAALKSNMMDFFEFRKDFRNRSLFKIHFGWYVLRYSILTKEVESSFSDLLGNSKWSLEQRPGGKMYLRNNGKCLTRNKIDTGRSKRNNTIYTVKMEPCRYTFDQSISLNLVTLDGGKAIQTKTPSESLSTTQTPPQAEVATEEKNEEEIKQLELEENKKNEIENNNKTDELNPNTVYDITTVKDKSLTNEIPTDKSENDKEVENEQVEVKTQPIIGEEDTCAAEHTRNVKTPVVAG